MISLQCAQEQYPSMRQGLGRDHTLLLLAIQTGLRLSELINLERDFNSPRHQGA
jgi:hypothetical protein